MLLYAPLFIAVPHCAPLRDMPQYTCSWNSSICRGFHSSFHPLPDKAILPRSPTRGCPGRQEHGVWRHGWSLGLSSLRPGEAEVRVSKAQLGTRSGTSCPHSCNKTRVSEEGKGWDHSSSWLESHSGSSVREVGAGRGGCSYCIHSQEAESR